MFDFHLTLHYFAKEDSWRVYAQSGECWTAKTIDEVQDAVKHALRSCGHTITQMGNEPKEKK